MTVVPDAVRHHWTGRERPVALRGARGHDLADLSDVDRFSRIQQDRGRSYDDVWPELFAVVFMDVAKHAHLLPVDDPTAVVLLDAVREQAGMLILVPSRPDLIDAESPDASSDAALGSGLVGVLGGHALLPVK